MSKPNPSDGSINFEHLLELLIQSGISSDVKPFPAAMRQMQENMTDAEGSWIDFLLDPGKSFVAIDNGHGVNAQGVERLNSLFQTHVDLAKTGKNDSGRLLMLAISELVRFYFVSGDYPQMHMLEFGRPQALTLLQENTLSNLPQPVSKHPQWWPFQNGETGTVVELVNPRWDLAPKNLSTLAKQLAAVLAPWNCEMVRFKGETIPPRFTEGRLPVTFTEPELGGKIQCVFYHLPNPGRRDVIQIGRNPLIELVQLVNGIHDPMVAKLVANDTTGWLLGSTVTGFIDIPAINGYAAHNRRELEPKFFEEHDLVRMVMTFLREKVAPKLADHYGLSQTTQVLDEKEQELDALAEMLAPTDVIHLPPPVDDDSGTRKVLVPPKPIRDRIIITPRNVTVCPGDPYEFKKRKGPRGAIHWTDDHSGGTLASKTGRVVQWVAGEKLGKYKLYLHERDSMQDAGVAEIEIVEERPFMIKPQMQTRFPREVSPLRLIGYDGDRCEWSTSSDYLTIIGEGKEVDLKIDLYCPPGYYQVHVRGENGKQDTATVRVGWYEGRLIEIDGEVYMLEGNPPSAPLVEQRGTSGVIDPRPGKRGVIPVMRVNTDAEVLDAVESQHTAHGRRLLVKAALIMEHLQGPSGDLERILRESTKRGGRKRRKSSRKKS